MDTVTADELASEVRSLLSGLPCWRVGLAFGSMVYFDFGKRVSAPLPRDRFAVMGEATVWLNADDWVIEYDGTVLARSDDIDRETAENELSPRFAGEGFEHLVLGSTRIAIKFTGGLSATAWRPEDAEIEPDEDLVTISLPDGRIAKFTAASGLVLSKDVDEVRATEYRKARGVL